MGIFDQKQETHTQNNAADIIEVHGKEEASDLVVIARINVTEEDEIWVTNALINTIARQSKRVSPDEQLKLADSLWLQRLIVSWNLPIPLEPDRAQAIASLTQKDREYIYKMTMDALPPKKEEKRLGLGVKKPSPSMQRAIQDRDKRYSRMVK